MVDDEARLLRDAGHHVELWAPEPEVGSGLRAASLGMSAVWSASAARRMRELVRAKNISIVHCHNLYPQFSPSIIRAARAAGAEVLVTLHNYRLMCLPAIFLRDGRVCRDCQGKVPWRGVIHRCYRDSVLGSAAIATSLTLHRGAGTFERVSRFLAVSEFVRAQHIEGGFSPDRIAVKPNFTWPVARRRGPGDYYLYLGRLSAEKGVSILTEVWRLGGFGELLVVGDGPDAEVLKANAPTDISFRPTISPSEVPDVIANARAVLVPSLCHEGAPRVVLESFAAGVPVIASTMGALPELLDGNGSGILVGEQGVAEWQEALTLVERDSVTMGDRAYEVWRSQYSPEVGLARLESAYEEVLR